MSSILAPQRRRALPDAKWVQPVQGYGITTEFGKPGPMWSSGYHTGADFAAPSGTKVRAVAAGRVSSVGPAGAYGNRVCIVHKPGFETWYCHLSTIAVSKGANLEAGAVIGEVGATGNVTGPHLHLEVRVDGMPRDPAGYLSGAVDSPASTSYDTGAQPQGGTTNAGLVSAGDSNAIGTLTAEVRRLVLVGTVLAGGAMLIVVGVAKGAGKAPRRERD